MRYFYVIICGLSSSIGVYAQEGPALTTPSQLASDSAWYEATATKHHVSSAVDSAGICTELLQWEDSSGLLRLFYPSGHLQEYSPCDNIATGRRHGNVTTWFDNGQLHTQQVYEQGRRTGPLLVYYENGGLKRRTEFLNGNELPGNCFDKTGAPVAYFPYERLPLYPGGYTQLLKDIEDALRLPRQLVALLSLETRMREARVVEIEFCIREDGQIWAPRVARSSQVSALDEAVLATIKQLTKRFSPGQRDGQLVVYTCYLPVQLTIPM
jgi:protein TonB